MIKKGDLNILNVLKQNSRLSMREISKKTNIPATTVHAKLRRLIKDGIIKKYTIELDMEKLGKPVLAYVLINSDYSLLKRKKLNTHNLVDQIIRHPNVETCRSVTGRFSFILTVRVKDAKELDNFINFLTKEEGILRSETLIVLYEAKKGEKMLDESLIGGS